MKMKNMGLGLATAAAVTSGIVLSGSPAHAFGLTDNPLTGVLAIDLKGLVQSTDSQFIDFGADNGDGDTATIGTTSLNTAAFALSDGSFGGITGGSIKDLKIGTSFPAGGITEFLTLIDANGIVTFDLFELIAQDFNNGTFEANVRGIFNPTGQGNAFRDTFQFRLTSKFNTATIELTPIPTPAVLPGLIGMGIAALRKKGKFEEAELAEAEA